ncbi:SgcJ/EcaC family oxidoreductase [Alteraurantiacibacter aquimixticola]|uniref:SgcJ/EcaC family oxidoreductase n=1 Tax=Alteraurantiacibacter aquimixticola TaxID=2489173 RepID=A0A4V4U8M4_9SPHN|nr:SgcJ/EcaC family oxidoreductase [Alteraurantiacibacter aquimixticola]TIX50523.1 SgcJ/EcaC family oxidoreductase [Alteraurantiacibacter aquimixticola]
MKFAKTALAAALVATTALAMPGAAQAQMRALSDPVVPHPDPESLFTSSDPVLHRNKQAALRIQRDLLKCGHWADAGNWLTDAYIQHNPVAASGLEGVIYYFTQIANVQPLNPCPALSAEDGNGVVAVMAEGDYVTILTRRIVPYADDPTQTYTTTWFDTWRFVDGKADEHWDPATLPTAVPSQALDVNKTLQEAHDRAQIEDLMWRYVRAIDGWNPDAYAAVFTEDGSFLGTQGRDNLRQMVVDLAANRNDESPELFHVMSNQNISFLSPSVAVVNYYWQTVSGGSPGAATPVLLAQGRGRDMVVKQTDGSWLIRSRDVTPD